MDQMVILHADQDVNPVGTWKYDKGRGLQDFYDALQCNLIEVVWDQPITLQGKTWNLLFLGDEEGLYKQKYDAESDTYSPNPTNYIVSFIRRINGVVPGYERVVGDVAIVKTNENRDFLPLSDEEAKELLLGIVKEFVL